MATLKGTKGRDTLKGKAAADKMFGLAGDDTLYGGGGKDKIRGGTANDKLHGGKANDTLFGDDGNDRLNGDDGNDMLDGGRGRDTMAGGKGNDAYVVDSAGDKVTERADQGIDTVKASISYTLGANLENLVLTGSADINGTGNTLNNLITGNSGSNTLNGGDGDDTLIGGGGADHFIGGIGNDTVSYAAATAGITIAYTSSYLGPEGDTFEAGDGLRVLGSRHDDAFTVSLADSAITTFDGGNGVDTIEIIDDTANADPDRVVVDLAAGTIVDTSGDTTGRTLARIEKVLVVAGSGSSPTAYTLRGNAEANLLQGGSGPTPADHDILEGRGGDDTLTGDGNNGFHNVDRFAFDTTTMGGTDTVTDFQDGVDLIQLVGAQWGLTSGGSVAGVLTVFGGTNPGGFLHFDTDTKTLYQYNNPGLPEAMLVLDGFSGTFSAADFVLV